jgi:hypothetical protein
MSNKNLVNYVKKQNNLLTEYKVGPLQIIVKDRIKNDVNLKQVFSRFNSLIPRHFIDLIDIVYIGQFDFFEEREINAMYLDGAIYISNEQDNDEDLLDDIIHEMAHAIEEKYGDFIYSDGKIEYEFLYKRKKLKNILVNSKHDMEKYDFFETEFNKEFDLFLYKEVGYDALRVYTINLFVDPYAPTSLREYFASGFEEFYLGDRVYLKEISSYIYNKLMILHEGETKNEF